MRYSSDFQLQDRCFWKIQPNLFLFLVLRFRWCLMINKKPFLKYFNRIKSIHFGYMQYRLYHKQNSKFPKYGSVLLLINYLNSTMHLSIRSIVANVVNQIWSHFSMFFLIFSVLSENRWLRNLELFEWHCSTFAATLWKMALPSERKDFCSTGIRLPVSVVWWKSAVCGRCWREKVMKIWPLAGSAADIWKHHIGKFWKMRLEWVHWLCFGTHRHISCEYICQWSILERSQYFEVNCEVLYSLTTWFKIIFVFGEF